MTTAATPAKAYRYSSEIAQMCFVYGELKEVDEAVAQSIEDIVRNQIGEIFIQARAQATRRNARHLAVEDLIFLIRRDVGKVNRLITYLGWKDVRKKVKDSEAADEGIDIESMEEPVNDKGLKAFEQRDRIPWLATNIYAEHVKDDSDGEGDNVDEVEMDRVSNKRLKDADTLTRNMTSVQYQHYAECRQASFTHRKAKRFREFVNVAAYIDGTPSDEVMDVLGFLACEMVRSLCEAGGTTNRAMSLAKLNADRAKVQDAAAMAAQLAKINERKRKREERELALENKDKFIAESTQGGTEASTSSAVPLDPATIPITMKVVPMAMRGGRFDIIHHARSPPRILIQPTSLFSEPIQGSAVSPSTLQPATVSPFGSTSNENEGTAGSAISTERATLTVEDLSGGYDAMLDDQASLRTCGFRNWRRGAVKRRSTFI